MAKGKPKPSRNGHRRSDQTPALFPDLPKHQRAFLLAFVETGELQDAARASRLSVRNHWYWKRNADYLEAFTQAEAMAVDLVEDRARRLALRGTKKGVYHMGIKVGEEEVVYPSLILAILNGYKSEVYRWKGGLTHELSPGMAELQRIWMELRDAPPEPRQLPPMHGDEADAPEVIDVESAPIETPRVAGGATKAHTFQVLDAAQGVESREWDEPEAERVEEPPPPSPAELWQRFHQRSKS